MTILHLIKDSVRRKLEASKESAYMSQKLAEIWLDAPTPLDLCGHGWAQSKKAVGFIADVLTRFEFRLSPAAAGHFAGARGHSRFTGGHRQEAQDGKLVQGLPDIKRPPRLRVFSRGW